jgi:hypothetical protein
VADMAVSGPPCCWCCRRCAASTWTAPVTARATARLVTARLVSGAPMTAAHAPGRPLDERRRTDRHRAGRPGR